MSSLVLDFLFALRSLARRPLFTLAAVATLALGIGANATVFSWVVSLVLEPVAGLHEPSRVVEILTVSEGERVTSLSYPNLEDIRSRTRTLAGVAGHEFEAVSLAREGEVGAERAWAELASASFFEVLGVAPAAGRFFRPEDDRLPLGAPVAVISHSFWQRRFGGEGAAVGAVVHVNGHPLTIVGVAPAGFQGGYSGLAFDLWVPLTLQPWIEDGGDRLTNRGSSWLNALGRLAPGVDLGQARAELAAIGVDLARLHPEIDRGLGFTVGTLADSPNGPQRVLGPVLLMLLAFVGLLLAVACANVANLLLARAAGRTRELAVRAALGAGAGSLRRLLFTEAIVVALAAGAVGLAIAWMASGVLGALVPPIDLPVRLGISVDARVVAFTLALSLLAALAFGLATARRASAANVLAGLRERGGAARGGRRGARVRDGLVVAQVALSLLLLVAAALFARSITAALRHDPGFDTREVLLAAFDLFPAGYSDAEGQAFMERLQERAAALPGVASASLARRVPLGFGGSSSSTFTVDGFDPAADERVWANVNWVGPDYFRTISLPLRRGREMESGDRAGAEPVVVVNEEAARRYWPGREAVGGTIELGGERRRVIGVVADADYRQLGEQPRPFLYLPLLQSYRSDVNLHLRTKGDPAALAGAVRRLVAELDPRLPLFNVRTMAENVAAASTHLRTAAMLLGVLGVAALAIAGVGLYGVLATSVAQRTQEIGVRMALGADRRRVLSMVLGHGARLASAGLLLGGVLGFVVARLLRGALFGIRPVDPASFALAAAVLVAATVLACALPALRAARLDPLVALRYE